jgi:hypothetical protein
VVFKLSVLDKVVTLKELSNITNIPESTIRTRIQAGSIPAKYYKKSGGTYLFSVEYIDYVNK